MATYTAAVATLVLLRSRWIPYWPLLVLAHSALLAALVLLPPRGTPWERAHSDDRAALRTARRTARFLRYTYPALLLPFLFEEVRFTVHALGPDDAYWFEPYLYAADLALFGALPAVALAEWSTPLLDEVMHAFYFSYFFLIIGGVVIAWRGPSRAGPLPRPGFHAAMTSMMLGFFLAYVWYPFLPARGPWENERLMAVLPEFDGFLFTPLVRQFIHGVAVSGGCFPSAHVAGTSGLIVGLGAAHRRTAARFSLVLAGLGVACVYARYHHAVDVVAGLTVGVAGGILGRFLTQPANRL